MRLLVAALMLVLCTSAFAKVTSETIFFLEDDGEHYLLQRSLHTRYNGHRFHVDKNVSRDDLRHVSPKNFQWQDDDPDVNTLIFNSSGFTLIYPGKLPESQLKKGTDNVYRYTSWDGETDKDGRYGYWFAPENYDSFVYSWVFPEGMEIISYKANRAGAWVQRGNAVSYYGEDVNNLVFDLRYKIKPQVKPAPEVITKTEVQVKEVIKVVTKEVEVPGKEVIKVITKEVEVPAKPKPIIDNDSDGVPDSSDDCPDTPPNTLVTVNGCGMDCDADGVINEKDRCPGTKPGVAVSDDGCKASSYRDGDKDKVTDEHDLCPDTLAGAIVDRVGCSMDTDKDLVPDGIDRCLATPEETRVDAFGCRLNGVDEAY